MSVFGLYSKYYDLLYRDKDYNREVNFILERIAQYQKKIKSILNLGCGTGKHDFLLAEKGYSTHGIDLSADMVEIAKSKNNYNTKFEVSDIRTFNTTATYDVIISLFHVINYQNTNEDIKQTFNTAYKHLNKGGIFLFDAWYGPAVLRDLPQVRDKNMEDACIRVQRYTHPNIRYNDNIVDVNFTIIIEDKKTQERLELKEVHSMRYLFNPEIKKIANELNFEVIEFKEWLTGMEPSEKSWNVYYMLKKGK